MDSEQPQRERQPCLRCKEPTLGIPYPGGWHLWVCYRLACMDKVWELYDRRVKRD